MGTDIELEKEPGERYTVIRVRGNVNVNTWERMAAEVITSFSDERPTVLPDWSQVYDFDTSGLRGLIKIYRFIKFNSERRFTLISGNEHQMTIFRATSLEKLFPIFPLIEDAYVALGLDNRDMYDDEVK